MNCLDIYRPKCEHQIKRNKVSSTSKGRAIRWTGRYDFSFSKTRVLPLINLQTKSSHNYNRIVWGEGGIQVLAKQKLTFSFSSLLFRNIYIYTHHQSVEPPLKDELCLDFATHHGNIQINIYYLQFFY